MKVIGVVGYPASGKGEFSQIAAGLGIPVVVMGDIIRRQVSAQGLDLTDENIGATARKLRED
ncbi:MAG TPA: AAA family ATPase, partial [Methanocorpusculum sp.]|nr:AAA family ATPase [Methanocorpusculum sp.]